MSFDENTQSSMPSQPEEPIAEAVAEAPVVEAPIEDTADRFSAFAQPTRPDAKKKEGKKKGNQRTRTLLLTTIVAGILAVAVLLITLLPAVGPGASSGETSDTTDSKIYTVLDKTKAEEGTVLVKKVEITNEDDTFTIVYNTSDRLYELVGYEDLLLDTEGTDSLVECATRIQGIDKVKDTSDLKAFGLDKPLGRVTITYHDDAKVTLLIGNETPSGDAHYIKLDGSDDVYICEYDSLAVFLTMASTYVDTTLITAPTIKQDDVNAAVTLREVTLSGRSHPKKLSIRRMNQSDSEELNYYTYVITEPYMRGAADEAANELVTFTGLVASQTLFIHPTDKEKDVLGFNDPLTVIDLTLAVGTTSEKEESTDEQVITFYNSADHRVIIGDKDENGNYIVMVEDIDAIFLVSASSLSMVAERTYDNTVSDLLFLKDIATLSKVQISVDGVKHDFALKHDSKAEKNDKKLIVTSGDKTYSTPDFRTLYQLMMAIERYGELKEEPTGKPVLSIALWDLEGDPYISVDIFAVSGSVYQVRTSQGEIFTTRTSNITHFIKQVDNFLKGEPVLVVTQ